MRNRCWALILCAAACWGCDTIECVKKGNQYAVTYTMENEVPIEQSVQVNVGTSQRGQCGSGPTATGWTKDCLRHDACQRYAEDHEGEDCNDQGEGCIKKELPGGLGPNCLDEFGEAIDDYSRSAEKCDGTNEESWRSW